MRRSFREQLLGFRNRTGAGIDTWRVLLPDDNGVKSWRLDLIEEFRQVMCYLCSTGLAECVGSDAFRADLGTTWITPIMPPSSCSSRWQW